MPSSSRDTFGAVLCLAGFALLTLSMMLYDRYSHFEEIGVLPMIAPWELAGFLWLGKWPIVGTLAAVGALLGIASPGEALSERATSLVTPISTSGDWKPGPKTPFSDTWTSTASRSDGGPGRILGS